MNLYDTTIVVFINKLNSLSAILKIAEKDAKKRGIPAEVFLNARLAPDMFSLTRQIQIATDHAKGCGGRLSGETPPYCDDKETSFDELQARIKLVKSFLKGLKANQFEGAEDRQVEVKTPIGELHFNGLDYYNGWAIPNFYFHLTCAYAILRHLGVSLGKRDFLGVIPGISATGAIAKKLNLPSKKKVKKTETKKKETRKKSD